MPPPRRGVYPGSFNPPTLAHIGIAEAARAQRNLDTVDLAISRVALEKETVSIPTFEDRIKVIRKVVADYDWLGVVVTDAQLFVDIAHDYDVIIMGADKWHQIQDPAYYENDPTRRDTAMAALPLTAIAPRPPHVVPDALLLDVRQDLGAISSTGAREGTTSWMHPHALAFDAETGAWTDQDRYLRTR